jgi:magnesium chelatase subunit D
MSITLRPVFPFTALVAQTRMKRALILNAVNPKLGGVLIRGEKGTAKSTAVRALANLLPDLTVVVDCPYGCDPTDPGVACESCRERHDPPRATRRVPLVELPVGATEDRVVGTLDLEHAIQEGRRRFEPGLLASANRGILYVDEVNLLNDHLVDLLLDAAAMGMNYVEREGVSIAHPSQFILVGTMNPEEGDLRPQLLDRFALAVEVEGLPDPVARADVVRRRIAFERDPAAFLADWREEELAERKRIQRARELLPEVRLDDRMLGLITQLCVDFEVDGLRADIVMYRAALTLAAYAGRRTVDEDDIRDAAELALLHRRRRLPFQQPQLDRDQLDQRIKDHLDDADSTKGDSEDDGDDEQNPRDGSPPEDAGPPPPDARLPNPGSPDQIIASGEQYAVKPLAAPADRRERREFHGRRSKAQGQSFVGHYVGAREPRQRVRDLALDATLRAAAVHQRERRAFAGAARPALLLKSPDLREKVRETRLGNLIIFVVDASGSMAARERMAAAKGAVLSLLLDAYQKRDQVGLVAFRGPGAELLLSPTGSVELAQEQLRELPTGGRTPLGHGLQLGLATFKRHLSRGAERLPLLVLVSDGRTNVSLHGGNPLDELPALGFELARRRVHTVVVDPDESKIRLGFAADVARALGADYLPIAQLAAGTLAGATRAAAWRRGGWA